ncbi:MAG: hypothetical protein E6I55_02110 [Chloroflexi bacterium]|nr:MAG: hypothetical protein E6I55_02110 [Chloroflexota bacterium]
MTERADAGASRLLHAIGERAFVREPVDDVARAVGDVIRSNCDPDQSTRGPCAPASAPCDGAAGVLRRAQRRGGARIN